jgi:hypothetical protein
VTGVSDSVWERLSRPRRRPSPRAVIVGSTLVLAAISVSLLVSHFRDSSAYRDGSAPELHGVVVSEPTHRHMTCGRTEDGYQVEVSYTADSAVRTEPLPTCSATAYPRGTFVTVWEERPDMLTTRPPGQPTHLLSMAIAVLVVLWAVVVGSAYRLLRRQGRNWATRRT